MEEPVFCSHYHEAFHSLAPVHHLQSFAKHTRACHSFHRAQHLRIGRNFISRARKQMLKSRAVGLTPCSEFTVEGGVWSQNPCPQLPSCLLSWLGISKSPRERVIVYTLLGQLTILGAQKMMSACSKGTNSSPSTHLSMKT